MIAAELAADLAEIDAEMDEIRAWESAQLDAMQAEIEGLYEAGRKGRLDLVRLAALRAAIENSTFWTPDKSARCAALSAARKALLSGEESPADILRQDLDLDLSLEGWSDGPSASYLRAELEVALEAEERESERKREAERQRRSGIAFPSNRQSAEHEGAHALAAAKNNWKIDYVTGVECRLAMSPPHGMDLVIFALVGEAQDRVNMNRLYGPRPFGQRELGAPRNLFGDSMRGASEGDLRIATLALGDNGRPWDWEEARRQALALGLEWHVGIDALARQLMLSGRMSGDDVVRTLRAAYRGDRYFLDQLQPRRPMAWVVND